MVVQLLCKTLLKINFLFSKEVFFIFKMRQKIRNWSRRYLPAEFAGLIVAYASYFFVLNFTGNLVISAYAAAIGENVGYYSTIFIRAMFQEGNLRKNVRNLFLEFGMAEFFDSVIIRPLSIGFFISLFGTGIGILIGKIVADILFYAQVIFCYERIVRR